ncbi:MAG: LuxR C-terminal-related transcriptional regulator [Nocardioides sp.]|nr:LuxR C-terminal-related transcriptional regulator [Nocardioides sp.]
MAVTSDQSLIAESVCAALADRGFDTMILGWPGHQADGVRPPGRARFGAGLMISELDTPAQVRSSRILLAERSGCWLVMTSAPRGPIWGAELEAGAARVVPTSWTLDQVAAGLFSLQQGAALLHAEDRAALVEVWNRHRSLRVERAERLQSLSPRERHVLEMLYDGVPVGSIAALLGISAATVRSQVKAILRKLDVRTQLAAVSTLEQHEADG